MTSQGNSTMLLQIIQRLYRQIQKMLTHITTKVFHLIGEAITNKQLSALQQLFKLNQEKLTFITIEALLSVSYATLSLRFPTIQRQLILIKSILRHITTEHFAGIKLANFKRLRTITSVLLVCNHVTYKQCTIQEQ